MMIVAQTSVPLVATDTANSIVSELQSLQTLPMVVSAAKMPRLEDPQWLVEQNALEARATVTVTYDVSTRGDIVANMAEFRSQANATLNDPRGWARMGVSFVEVESGGMLTLVLAEAIQMPSFSSGCSTEYSCRAGRFVVINQDRWLGATSPWNQAGGTLRDYRHMVINHETGHWLGHDHETCGGPGQPAPVMQQQSISLQGCSFNPWPTEGELWSTQLGIAR